MTYFVDYLYPSVGQCYEPLLCCINLSRFMVTSNVYNGVKELADSFNHALYVLLNFPVGRRDFVKSLVKRNVVSDHTKNVVKDFVSQLNARFGVHIESACVFCALEEAHRLLSQRLVCNVTTFLTIPFGIGASSFPDTLLSYLDKRCFKDKFLVQSLSLLVA